MSATGETLRPTYAGFRRRMAVVFIDLAIVLVVPRTWWLVAIFLYGPDQTTYLEDTDTAAAILERLRQ